MKINKLGYLLKEGFKSIFTHGFMSFASVTIIVACLIIMGSFGLLALNIDAIIKDLEDENQMIAFVDEALSDADALSIAPSIEKLPNVSQVEFVSREQAMEEFKQEYQESSFEDIEAEVFRHRYVIYMDDLTIMKTTKADVEGVEGIAEVSASIEIAEGFIIVRNIVSAVSLILVAILAVVSVFIMANTIKLATFSRRDEIAIMKMVGANDSFIRFPFVVEGLVLGLVGGGIAFGIEWGLYTLVSDKVMAGIVGSIVNVIPFSELLVPVLAVYLGIGFLVGTFGSAIAIRNYLKV